MPEPMLTGGPFSFVCHYFDPALSNYRPATADPDIAALVVALGGAVKLINSKIASRTCQQPRKRRAVDRGADQGARCEAEGAACSKLPQEATKCCIEGPEVDAPELHIARGIVHIICFRMPACFSATSKESLLSWYSGRS